MKSKYIIFIICVIIGIGIMYDRHTIAEHEEPGKDIIFDIGFIMFFPAMLILVIDGAWGEIQIRDSKQQNLGDGK